MDSPIPGGRQKICHTGRIKRFMAGALIPSAEISLTACTSLMQFSSPLGRYVPSDLLLDNSPQTIAHEDLDRYACHNGGALECVCESRLDSKCLCQCPFPVP
jgi:hypothetical protein